MEITDQEMGQPMVADRTLRAPDYLACNIMRSLVVEYGILIVTMEGPA